MVRGWDQGRGFLGSDRFRIERRLGEGSMGAVYLAYDRQREAPVALKTLRRVDPGGIYRFKREFRALSDLSHPNLVCLHELFSQGEQWFFTMEYIEGRDFLSYVLDGSRHTPQPALEGDDAGPDSAAASEPHAARVRGMEMMFPSPLRDTDRVRDVLIQVAEGLMAVHRAGKLHRDLKSDNVLVTADGRAVLLDFGVVWEQLGDVHSTLEPGVLGTPAYMSPEQAAGAPTDEATDWYSLGVMLYEALTGNVPFDGSYGDVLRRKQRVDAVPPALVVSNVPEDLNELCIRLLDRDAAQRPRGEAVVRALRRRRAVSEPVRGGRDSADRASPFIGRSAQLAALERHLISTDHGRPVLTYVHGPSGIGKTTLVERFIEQQVRSNPELVVLKGRCYERESVPFKAIDSLIDSLTRYLRRLSSVEVAQVLPLDIRALAQLFPVLRRVELIKRGKRRSSLPPEPTNLRRRAFRALKELFCRIADQRRLLLFIDDLQWGYVDSDRLIEYLVSGADSAAMLLVGAYRSGELQSTACLDTLFSLTRGAADVDVREVHLSVLSHQESYELARRLLGDESQVDARAVGAESHGSPYLLTELVRHVREAGQVADKGSFISLEQALAGRLRGLSSDAVTLLELVSVAGRPVAEETLALVSTFDIDLQAALSELRAARLVRGVALRTGRAIEAYHDRVREAVVSQLSAERLRMWHRRLATSLEASGTGDLEALTAHLLGAGDLARAGLYAARAADQAVEAVAFEKAARLYALAVEHHNAPWQRHELMVRWADSLTRAGRGAQAAEVYLQAAQEVPEADQPALRRSAGLQLLLSGYAERGMQLLRSALREVGVALPKSSQQAREQTERWHKELATRRFDFPPREEEDVAEAQLERLDTLWAVALGLMLNEVDRPLPLVARYLWLALEVGERRRVVRGLCLYAMCIDGPLQREGQRAQGALERAEALAEDRPQMEELAWVALARGAEDHALGLAVSSLAQLSRAEALFRDHCPGSHHEMRLCRQLASSLHVVFSQTRRLSQCEGWAREAEDRGDRVMSTRLRLFAALLSLVGDDPERARRRIALAVEDVEPSQEDISWVLHWCASSLVDLYTGDAVACLEGLSPPVWVVQSSVWQVPFWRAVQLSLRVRLALGGAAHASEPGAILGQAQQDIEALASLALSSFEPMVFLHRAALAELQGEDAARQRALERARELAAADRELHRWVEVCAEHQLARDPRGGEQRPPALSTGLSARNPARFLQMLWGAPSGPRLPLDRRERSAG